MDMKQDANRILKRLDDEKKKQSSECHNYKTVRSLIAFEMKKYPTAPEERKTLAALKRLHREGDFIQVFLKRTIEDLERTDSLVEMAHGTYDAYIDYHILRCPFLCSCYSFGVCFIHFLLALIQFSPPSVRRKVKGILELLFCHCWYCCNIFLAFSFFRRFLNYILRTVFCPEKVLGTYLNLSHFSEVPKGRFYPCFNWQTYSKWDSSK